MDILRFITAGSVDDGKSTLIGRLLYDSKSIMIDQLTAIQQQTKHKAVGEIDLALLTDGLRAEREQGITIDVAYKYFSTPKRKFIIADAPGHIQYTRNMITGASNANLIIVLIDARNGVVEQTRRHSLIASILKIPHVVVAVNKMDMVGYAEDVFNNIMIDYAVVAEKLGLKNVTYIPISALKGDNIVEKSTAMSWYDGSSLLSFLENVPVRNDVNLSVTRFPVQYVIRPQGETLHDYRGYAGKLISGILKVGDAVSVLPQGINTHIASIEHNGKNVEEAFAPQSIIVHLADDVDVSRGNVIVPVQQQPLSDKAFSSMICWMDTKPLQIGNRYWLQLNSTLVKCIVTNINYVLNVDSLTKQEHIDKIQLNEIASITLKTATPLVYDKYESLPVNGAAILIDEATNVTVGACMIQ
ncbi:sulfate adenylyltransferase subunit 1 [Hydrotalea sandarakina]|jgi:sulfate adenylyltransferase subunit 1|uniref:sulfate adenylyltransferase n=1 Tax=Hydrotalea sandarakina TaxID=1004304 RepID=A0A2W7SSF9_9BACT|nr:GTP-binding protein [Hydrotalea sandarakina]PZX65985.1 sulfate adenylyltransferase subunit 1 [Hydrotalea sandarakina]